MARRKRTPEENARWNNRVKALKHGAHTVGLDLRVAGERKPRYDLRQRRSKSAIWREPVTIEDADDFVGGDR